MTVVYWLGMVAIMTYLPHRPLPNFVCIKQRLVVQQWRCEVGAECRDVCNKNAMSSLVTSISEPPLRIIPTISRPGFQK